MKNDKKACKKTSAEIYEKILETLNFDEIIKNQNELRKLLNEPINKFIGA